MGGWRAICWTLVFSSPLAILLFTTYLWRVGHVSPVYSPSAWFGLSYQVLVSQFIGFALYYRGLARGGVARMSQIQQFQSVLAVLAAALILGEQIDLQLWVVLGLLLAAVVGARWALGAASRMTNDRMTDDKMGRVLVNGITVAYEDVGGGDNVLVLVHGHPFNRTMWRPQVELFNRFVLVLVVVLGIWRACHCRLTLNSHDRDEREPAKWGSVKIEDEDEDEYEYELRDENEGTTLRSWRAIVPDLRGYGESTVVAGKTTLDIFARDIAALLDELGIRDVVIGGLSMGGQIAMEFCRLYPERVRGVLLAATFCRAETEEGRRQRVAMADRLLNEGMEPYAQEVLPKMVTPANLIALPRVADHVRAMMRATNPVGAAAAVRGRAERPDYAETLARVDVPAAVVVGDEDAFTTRADAERMSTSLKQSELVWMKGVGHMPNLEREAEFNEALGRLLARCADDK